MVLPPPLDALLTPNGRCVPVPTKSLHTCHFGAGRPDEPRDVALIGDSHASHWRAALDVVALRHGWRGMSLTHTGCPLSLQTRTLQSPSLREDCRRWNRRVVAWLRRNRTVHTVFVSQNAGGDFVTATPQDGYVRAWRALPRSVRRIVVIRDIPMRPARTLTCLLRSHGRRSPGVACAVPRAEAVLADPAVAAAGAVRGRVHAVDLTRFFCGNSLCFPVIGGALVHKDMDHMTEIFAATLGPYLDRAYRSLIRR
jgi:hypothetical protein